MVGHQKYHLNYWFTAYLTLIALYFVLKQRNCSFQYLYWRKGDRDKIGGPSLVFLKNVQLTQSHCHDPADNCWCPFWWFSGRLSRWRSSWCKSCCTGSQRCNGLKRKTSLARCPKNVKWIYCTPNMALQPFMLFAFSLMLKNGWAVIHSTKRATLPQWMTGQSPTVPNLLYVSVTRANCCPLTFIWRAFCSARKSNL